MDLEIQGSNPQSITMTMKTQDGLTMTSVVKNTENLNEDSLANEFISQINQKFGGLIKASKVNKPVKKLKLKLKK